MHFTLTASLMLAFLGGMEAIGCSEEDEATESAGVQTKHRPEPTSGKPFVELTDAFLTRAQAAFDTRLEPETKILEMRVTGDVFSLQMQTKEDIPASEASKSIPAGSLVQLDYLERPGQPGQPPIGKIRGPARIDTRGEGEVKDNLFPFSEVRLSTMGRKFRIAVLAIDPLDGRVEKLVVRRNLPFGKRVRGRIYVHSPRMSGSIDVNEKGTVLKR